VTIPAGRGYLVGVSKIGTCRVENIKRLDILQLVYKLVYIDAWRNTVNIKVGSYEAKTKLPELLRGVQAGNHYTITLRGEAVAELVPAHFDTSPDKGAAVDDMLAFMKNRKSVASFNLKALINEGRE
jgi:antitoxin (DNA-binding transcriptional repressor) of toxin-antitoxin stability system